MSIIETLRGVIEELEQGGVHTGREAELIKALEFYADPATWTTGGTVFEPEPALVAKDKGELARKVLGKATPKKKGGKGKAKAKVESEPKAKSKPQKERASRPPASMVNAKCRACKSTQPLPSIMVLNKFNDKGELEENYICPRCIKEGKFRE